VEAGVPGAGTLERNTKVDDAKLEVPSDRQSYMCGVAGSAVPRAVYDITLPIHSPIVSINVGFEFVAMVAKCQ
jgi:hypothetical protein